MVSLPGLAAVVCLWCQLCSIISHSKFTSQIAVVYLSSNSVCVRVGGCFVLSSVLWLFWLELRLFMNRFQVNEALFCWSCGCWCHITCPSGCPCSVHKPSLPSPFLFTPAQASSLASLPLLPKCILSCSHLTSIFILCVWCLCPSQKSTMSVIPQGPLTLSFASPPSQWDLQRSVRLAQLASDVSSIGMTSTCYHIGVLHGC